MAGIVKAELESLNDLAQFLNSASQDFGALLSKMTSCVQSINGGWQGVDSGMFVANASAYLSNLHSIQKSLVEGAICVGKCNTKYAQAIIDFYSALG